MRGVVRATCCVALLALSAGYLASEKKVTLIDRGRALHVTTFAANVSALFDRRGVEVAGSDQISPHPKASLPARVEIHRAKQVVIVEDGARREERVIADTVEEVLDELSIRREGAKILPRLGHRIRSGEEIVVKHPTEVKILEDRNSQSVVTNDLTIGGVLRRLGITLGPLDRVEPNLVAHPAPGATIRITRIGQVVDEETTPIPFKRLTRPSNSLELGVTKLGRAGRDGIRKRTFQVTFVDGRPRGRKLISDVVARPPVDEIQLVGTFRPPAPVFGNFQSGRATWYQIGGLTAAHRTLPMGTTVLVTNVANGRQVTVTIRDRGPWGYDRIIDLSDAAFSQLAPLGTGVINVKIAW